MIRAKTNTLSKKEIKDFKEALKEHNSGDNALKILILEKKPERILYLTLKKDPFDVMVTGEKPREYRKPSKWIHSRLYNKDGSKKEYDFVVAVNGYGNARPMFKAEYKGFTQAEKFDIFEYSNGLKVRVAQDDYIIQLGEVTEYKNLKL